MARSFKAFLRSVSAGFDGTGSPRRWSLDATAVAHQRHLLVGHLRGQRFDLRLRTSSKVGPIFCDAEKVSVIDRVPRRSAAPA